jgi:biopolymer transport protein TolR
MRRQRQRRRTLADINVVPYIDVMLVLVVIFMVTTPLLSQGVKVNLPKANAQTLSAQDQTPLIVTVSAKGEYFLNTLGSSPIASENLINLVHEALAKNPDRKVYVRGDEAASYGEVVGAMVDLQQAGVENVGLMTNQPDSSNPSNQSGNPSNQSGKTLKAGGSA